MTPSRRRCQGLTAFCMVQLGGQGPCIIQHPAVRVQVGLALRQEGTVLLYGRLGGATACVRVGDFLYGGKILEGEQLCHDSHVTLTFCGHDSHNERQDQPAPVRQRTGFCTGFAVPRWIVQKRAAGQMDKEVAAAWDLIVQGVIRPNTGVLVCSEASSCQRTLHCVAGRAASATRSTRGHSDKSYM